MSPRRSKPTSDAQGRTPTRRGRTCRRAEQDAAHAEAERRRAEQDAAHAEEERLRAEEERLRAEQMAAELAEAKRRCTEQDAACRRLLTLGAFERAAVRNQGIGLFAQVRRALQAVTMHWAHGRAPGAGCADGSCFAALRCGLVPVELSRRRSDRNGSGIALSLPWRFRGPPTLGDIRRNRVSLPQSRHFCELA